MIKKSTPVSCSLNLGFIYSLNYNFIPREGTRITISFVNESGIYNVLPLSMQQKVAIQIGNTTFSMYALKSRVVYSTRQRTIEVDFIDETFLLNNYLVVLTGRGCGIGVYPLGKPVDTRTSSLQISQSLDPIAEQVRQFTQFQDLEYGFADFIAILRQIFPVQITANFDITITKAYTGTFHEVLDSWCSFFNLSYFFENGLLKIFDPTQLIITLPAPPIDAIEYTQEQSFENTYNKTVYAHFADQGREIQVTPKNDQDITTFTLYQVGAEFDLPQTTMDMDQVTAAMHGEKFWFLYNYVQGTATQQCGWNITDPTKLNSFANTFNALKAGNMADGVATLDTKIFQTQYEAYRKYGESIAGRYYLSNEVTFIKPFKDYTWFDQTNGQIFDLSTSQAGIDIRLYDQDFGKQSYLPESIVNEYFPGINMVGARLYYYDSTKRDYETIFALSQAQQDYIESVYQFLAEGIGGSSYMDYSAIDASVRAAGIRSVTYKSIASIQDLTAFLGIGTDLWTAKKAALGYANSETDIIGLSVSDYNTMVQANSTTTKTPNSTTQSLANNTQFVSDQGVLTSSRAGKKTVYYSKYEQCNSASSNILNAFGRQFVLKDFSIDIPIIKRLTNPSKNTYTITRDLSYINAIINSGILNILAQGRNKPVQTISFKVNYFIATPVNFLSSGLVGLSLDISEAGISATYTYSNAIYNVLPSDAFIEKLERAIKNSWVRNYNPQDVVT